MPGLSRDVRSCTKLSCEMTPQQQVFEVLGNALQILYEAGTYLL